jgi:hypothetical protein
MQSALLTFYAKSSSLNQLPAEAMASALDTLFGVEKDGKDYMVQGVRRQAFLDS